MERKSAVSAVKPSVPHNFCGPDSFVAQTNFVVSPYKIGLSLLIRAYLHFCKAGKHAPDRAPTSRGALNSIRHTSADLDRLAGFLANELKVWIETSQSKRGLSCDLHCVCERCASGWLQRHDSPTEPSLKELIQSVSKLPGSGKVTAAGLLFEVRTDLVIYAVPLCFAYHGIIIFASPMPTANRSHSLN